MLMTSTGGTTGTGGVEHAVELRTHATKEIITLALGHSSPGLAWARSSLANPPSPDGLVPQSSDGAWGVRANVITIDSGNRRLSLVGPIPAPLRKFATDV
ncbi:hypothetical protein diail_764 [Diaporthe ilicicola]|nr:hypothetical protein diail_764 [Diaporthe ilicicola]